MSLSYNSIYRKDLDVNTLYQLVSSSKKIPLTIDEINQHLKTEFEGFLYNSTLSVGVYALDAGLNNISSYTDTIRIRFFPDTTNSGAVDVNVAGIGATDLKDKDGNDFAAGALDVNSVFTFAYSLANTEFRQVATNSTEQDFDYIYNTVLSIIDWFEKFTRKDLFTKTWLNKRDCLFDVMQLRKSPMQSITQIQYLSDEVLTTLSNTLYYLELLKSYSNVVRENGAAYPTVDTKRQSVEITFTSGFGDDVSDMPYGIRQAFLFVLASLNQYRGDCIGPAKTSCYCDTSQIPPQALSIFRKYRIQEIF